LGHIFLELLQALGGTQAKKIVLRIFPQAKPIICQYLSNLYSFENENIYLKLKTSQVASKQGYAIVPEKSL
jgi:hypothetical protein